MHVADKEGKRRKWIDVSMVRVWRYPGTLIQTNVVLKEWQLTGCARKGLNAFNAS